MGTEQESKGPGGERHFAVYGDVTTSIPLRLLTAVPQKSKPCLGEVPT